jgi:uncharacterized protein (DUF1810 family)
MDKFNLQRFIDAQEEPLFSDVIKELKRGLKKSHWMWFIFPQVFGLGKSHNSKLYGIISLEEAAEYWQHPLLGRRLRDCIGLVIDSGKSSLEIFGEQIDVIKFQSCLTLFIKVDPSSQILKDALNKLFSGKLDKKTMAIIQKAGQPPM